MVFTVFVSHSTKDVDIVRKFVEWMKSLNIQVYVAEWSYQPNQLLTEKISKNIDATDCVLAILTKGGTRSDWVNQELGYAQKAGKTIIPMVEEGVEVKGFIAHVDQIRFNKKNVNEAVIKAATVLQGLASQKAEKEKQNAFWGGLFVLGLLALLASGDK